MIMIIQMITIQKIYKFDISGDGKVSYNTKK